MIYCSFDGGWLVMAQPAHSWSAGHMAAAWGNADFYTPNPHDAVVLATRLHDIGWIDGDAAPALHPDGRPWNFTETPLSSAFEIWRRAVSEIGLFNLYSALLVSMHATTIYESFLRRDTYTPEERSDIQGEWESQKEIQAGIRAHLKDHPIYGAGVDPVQLQANYRVLRACDLLSLAMCTGPLSAGEIEDVPAGSAEARTTIQYMPVDERTLALRPYPFSAAEVAVNVEARRLTERVFPDLPTFYAALQSAPRVTLEFKVVAG